MVPRGFLGARGLLRARAGSNSSSRGSITSVGSNGGTTRGSSTALQLCHRDHQLSSHLISSEGQQGATGQGLHLSSLPPPPPSRLPTAPETRPCDLWQKFDAQRKTNVKKRRDHPQTKTAAQHEVSACRTRAQTIRSYSPEAQNMADSRSRRQELVEPEACAT